LQSALDEEDQQKAVHAAHSIKGAAINLGLVELYEFAKSMEINARENHLAKVNEMAKKAKEEIDRIAKCLSKEK
jgi:HPt (histidine-containing phosphotransfer) domain-containing protein